MTADCGPLAPPRPPAPPAPRAGPPRFVCLGVPLATCAMPQRRVFLTYLLAGGTGDRPVAAEHEPPEENRLRDARVRPCQPQASPCDGLMGGMHLGKHAGVCPGMYMSALRVCVSRWCLLSPGGCVPVGRFSLSGTLFSRSRSTLSLSHSTGRAAARTLNDTAGTVRLQIIICQTPHQGKDRTSCTTAPSIGRWALHSGSRPLLRQGRR